MPVLTPALEEKRSLLTVPNFAKLPLKIPAWSVVLVVVMAAAIGFGVGRHKPAHHYVSYFGYPMVLDTTTGKACYATKPKMPEPGTVQDAAFPPAYEDSNRLDDKYIVNGAAVPLCGQE